MRRMERSNQCASISTTGFSVLLIDSSFNNEHTPEDLNPDQPGWSRACCRYTRGMYKSNPAEAVRLELTNHIPAVTCFQDKPLIQPDDFR